jgi:hypothetical protein
VAHDQQRMNQAALSSYAAELHALRESLGAKKSSLLPGSQSISAGERATAAPDLYVSTSQLAVACFSTWTAAGMTRFRARHGSGRDGLLTLIAVFASEHPRLVTIGSSSLGGRLAF